MIVDEPDSGEYVYRVRGFAICGYFPGFYLCGQTAWLECAHTVTVPPGRMNPSVAVTSGNTQSVPNGFVTGTASDPDGNVARVEWRTRSEPGWKPATPIADDWSEWTFPSAISLGSDREYEIRAIDNQGFRSTRPVTLSVGRPNHPSVIAFANPAVDTSVSHTTASFALRGTVTDDDPEPIVASYRVITETRFNQTVYQSMSGSLPLGIDELGSFAIEVPLNYGTTRVRVETVQEPNFRAEKISPSIVREFPPASDALLCLTDTGEVWATGLESGSPLAFADPYRASLLGYRHEPSSGWQTIAGDFTGDGVTDLACATRHGDLWMARGDGSGGFTGNARQSTGWRSNERSGEGIVAADANGDGILDVVNIHGGRAWVGMSNGSAIAAPVAAGAPGIRYRPGDGYRPFFGWWVGSGRFNDDARDDLVQADPEGSIFLYFAQADGTYAPPLPCGALGFAYDRPKSRGLHVGDFNGDGREDLVAISATGGLRFALSTGSGFRLTPVSNPPLGFRDAANAGLGWSTHVADLNGDGRDDLMCLTEYTDVWGSLSNSFFAGNWQGFGATPSRLAWLGFQHKDVGPWQTFPARLVP